MKTIRTVAEHGEVLKKLFGSRLLKLAFTLSYLKLSGETTLSELKLACGRGVISLLPSLSELGLVNVSGDRIVLTRLGEEVLELIDELFRKVTRVLLMKN